MGQNSLPILRFFFFFLQINAKSSLLSYGFSSPSLYDIIDRCKYFVFLGELIVESHCSLCGLTSNLILFLIFGLMVLS